MFKAFMQKKLKTLMALLSPYKRILDRKNHSYIEKVEGSLNVRGSISWTPDAPPGSETAQQGDSVRYFIEIFGKDLRE